MSPPPPTYRWSTHVFGDEAIYWDGPTRDPEIKSRVGANLTIGHLERYDVEIFPPDNNARADRAEQ